MIALNYNIKQMSSTNMPMGNLISYQGTGVNKLAIQKDLFQIYHYWKFHVFQNNKSL